MDLSETQHATLCAIVGPRGVIAGAALEPHLQEWRKRWQGATPLALAPASTEETARIVQYCQAQHIAVTPQGGNTGLVGGQIPHGQVLISMTRMNKLRELNPLNNTLTVEAGMTLAEAQAIATEAERFFPLSIGAQGTCQIGGNISTNAGGVNVIRYGNMRDLVLGLEVVLPNGDIWHGLNSLRKNNTGYDLKHMFIGAEGTLGLITAGVLKLFPQADEKITGFVSIPNVAAAVELLALMQSATGGLASSFELISRATHDLVIRNIPNMRAPLPDPAPWYILLEFSTSGHGGFRQTIETTLADALERGLIKNATLAQNTTQADQLWALRHNASAAMAQEAALCAKCDISVPIHKIPNFLQQADQAILATCPAARIIAFGHLGDGNIHYDILGPAADDQHAFTEQMAVLEHLVHDIASALGGSISAEHGIGQLKRDELPTRKSLTEMAMMKAIKMALDPKGIMNPGKLL